MHCAVNQAHGLLHASHFRKPTCIRNPIYRSTCSYRYAFLIEIRVCVQAPTAYFYGNGALNAMLQCFAICDNIFLGDVSLLAQGSSEKSR